MAEPLTVEQPEFPAVGDAPAGVFLRALDEMGHGVVLLEGERIVDASRAFCELVGYDRRQLVELASAITLVPAEHRDRVRALLGGHLAGKDGGGRFAVPVMTAAGGQITLDMAIRSYGDDEDPPRLLVLANDITERRDHREQLHFQKRLLEAIAEASLDAVLVVAGDGHMTYFNRRFVDLWAIPDEVVASRSDEAAVTAVRERLVDPDGFVDRVAYLYDHPLEESNDELLLRDGRVLERYSAPVVDDEGIAQGRVWFFRDVTDERRAQVASQLLAKSGELFGSPLDVERTLTQLAELVVPLIADWAAVDVLEDARRFRRAGVAHVDPAGAALLHELHERYPLRANEGRLRGQVIASGQPIALYDLDETQLRGLARDEEHFELLRRLGIQSALWVPLIVRERAVGVLSAGYRPGPRRYSAADLELLSELARRAALALDNAMLYQAVARAEKRQAALATLGQQALSGMAVGELAQAAADALAEVMDVPFVEVLQLLPDRRRLALVAGVGWAPGLVGSATVKAGLGSQGGYTLTTVGPVRLDDLATEKRFRPSALLRDHGVVSGLTVVIGSPHDPYGVLGTHTAKHRVFADDDIHFLQAVANVLAAATEQHADQDRLNALAGAEQARAAQLKVVIESIGDAVVVCDGLGFVMLANPAARGLLGEHLEDGLIGVLRAFEWPTELPAEQLEPGRAIELRLADGGDSPPTERWVELSTFPVRTGDQPGPATGGTILVLRDVTAARSARAVRDAFIGMLSHELRTPVTTIYGGSEMLSRESSTLSAEKQRELHEDIRAEADRLYRLVENLLVLSRVERQGLQIDAEPVLIQRLIPRVVESESIRWPSAEWVNELPPNLPPVAAEETYIEQVLRNLLGNAAKYGGDGTVTIRATDDGAVVTVTVSDRGAGFAEDEAERLFELFYRSPSVVRRASGAGIGLFVSRQLIDAMGGRLWARNREGGGAEFGFQLPIFESPDE